MTIQTMKLGEIGTNCYLIWDESAQVCALVDPGDNAPVVLDAIAKTGAKLECILLTHGHYDHTMAIRGIRAQHPDVPVYIGRGDASDEDKAPFYQFPMAENRIFWQDGDSVTVGNSTIHVLATPGHSPGSVVLQMDDVLFTGDTLFRGSCGRVDLPGGDYKTILTSLKRLAQLEGDYRVLPGHEGTSTLDTERKNNYYMREAMAQ